MRVQRVLGVAPRAEGGTAAWFGWKWELDVGLGCAGELIGTPRVVS